jgi:hypothetical protein
MDEGFTEVKNGELDWDDIITDTGSDWTPLPEGDYPFEVTKFERGRYEGGAKLPPCNMAILTLNVDGGKKGTATVTHRLYLHTKTQGLNFAFFRSIGQAKAGDTEFHPRWNEVTGSKGTCKLEIHEYTKKDGTSGQSNQVKKFLPPAEKAAPTQGGWKAGKF